MWQRKALRKRRLQAPFLLCGEMRRSSRVRRDTAARNSIQPVGAPCGIGYYRNGDGLQKWRVLMKIVYPTIGCIILALTVSANAATSLSDDFWLLGNFTQNVPCKGDGTDPAEAKVEISPQQIESKIGVCTFLDTKEDSKSVKLHVECQFPAGPLMGEITFTQKPNNTIDFIDRDKTYNATLYRCPK
jgi:hypothetical protein